MANHDDNARSLLFLDDSLAAREEDEAVIEDFYATSWASATSHSPFVLSSCSQHMMGGSALARQRSTWARRGEALIKAPKIFKKSLRAYVWNVTHISMRACLHKRACLCIGGWFTIQWVGYG